MSGTTLAADFPAPTFLESGDNDLIRFQKGEVVDQEIIPPPSLQKMAPPVAKRMSAARRQSPETEAPAPQDQPLSESSEEVTSSLSAPLMDSASDQVGEESDMAPQAPAAILSAEVPAVLKPEVASGGLDEAIDARLVTVCLNNPAQATGAKAFDIRRDSPPRYVADIGATSCARFEPTRHTLYLWKTNDIGALSLILSSRLDLNDSDGTQVTLDWLKDR
ncbi:hypothetical protein [Roseibium sp. SCP14]|uniref:hypothetical protein n=1 Tax=Roseibium sp. SCP14 TaxID=3141375 RepID=UPI00333D5865